VTILIFTLEWLFHIEKKKILKDAFRISLCVTMLNEDLLRLDLDDCVADNNNIDNVYHNWFRCFRQIVEKYIPNKTVIIRPRDKPWMTSVVRTAICKRNRLLKKFCKNK
jgi:hypothetical protein